MRLLRKRRRQEELTKGNSTSGEESQPKATITKLVPVHVPVPRAPVAVPTPQPESEDTNLEISDSEPDPNVEPHPDSTYNEEPSHDFDPTDSEEHLVEEYTEEIEEPLHPPIDPVFSEIVQEINQVLFALPSDNQVAIAHECLKYLKFRLSEVQ